jgi:hypothetical protein
MHLVNILRIITFSCLVGHSNLTISDFNSFRFLGDTYPVGCTVYCEFRWTGSRRWPTEERLDHILSRLMVPGRRPQSHKIEELCLMLNCTSPCTNPLSQLLIKYSSSWLQRFILAIPILDDYFIIRKYNELNHRDRAQININSDKNIKQRLLLSSQAGDGGHVN